MQENMEQSAEQNKVQETVEVRVNILNQIQLLRRSTFKDKVSFLDEDIQNANRAKAKRVDVTYEQREKRLIIENDGKILGNPQVLFSMAESEWDEDVKANENPFGLGFFSNITVSDDIEIFSGDKHVVFDIGDMIAQGRTDIKVFAAEERYEGFKLVLNNIKTSEVSPSEIRERVGLLGKYVHELDIYFNGVLQQKKDLTEGDGSAFQIKIEDDSSFKGWLALADYYSQGVNVFYKGRLVKKLENFYYLKGDLHITDKALNLTSPDRKDIIQDDKLRAFEATLRTYAALLAEHALATGNEEELERFVSAISYYADKREIKKKLKFRVFKGGKEQDMTYLEGVALAMNKKGADNITTFSKYELFLREEAREQEESKEMELRFSRDFSAAAGEPSEYDSADESHESDSSERNRESSKKPKEKIASYVAKAESVFAKAEEHPVFWMKFSEVDSKRFKLKLVQHYGVKLIVSRNRFEDEVLQGMKDDNILHIDELSEDVRLEATLSNTELSQKEKRALMLLDMLSRMWGFKHNAFVIGDLMVLKQTTVASLNKKFEFIVENAVAYADVSAKKVYVDRAAIEKSMLGEETGPELSLADYKFLLANLDSFVKEISLLNFDGKEKLFEKTLSALAAA